MAFPVRIGLEALAARAWRSATRTDQVLGVLPWLYMSLGLAM